MDIEDTIPQGTWLNYVKVEKYGYWKAKKCNTVKQKN